MTFFSPSQPAQPPVATDLIDAFLRAATVSALRIWSSGQGDRTQFDAALDPATPPPSPACEHVATYWLEGAGAALLKAKCVEALTGGDFRWREDGVNFAAAGACAVVEQAARRCDLSLVPDALARSRVAAALRSLAPPESTLPDMENNERRALQDLARRDGAAIVARGAGPDPDAAF